MLVPQDLVDLARRSLGLVGLVDHHVVVLGAPLHLHLRVAVAPLQLGRRLGAATGQARLAILGRWRRDEDAQRLGDQLLDLLGALDVDLQDRVTPGAQRGFDLVARRARPIPVHLARLQQSPIALEPLELGGVHELVVDALDLAFARPARLVGHHEVALGLRGLLLEPANDRVLAHARGSRDDHHHRTACCAERRAHRWTSRRPARTASRAAGRDASARIRCSFHGAANSIRHECRNIRSSPSGPRRAAPVA